MFRHANRHTSLRATIHANPQALSAAAAHIPGADSLKTAAQFLLFHAPAILALIGLAAAGLARPVLARAAAALLVLGLILFIFANFSYQAALIYYDATLKTVSTPESRGRLSGIGTAIGYCGTVVVALLIFFLDVPVADRFRLAALLYLVFSIPIFAIVRKPKATNEPPLTVRDVVAAFGQLRVSIAHARSVPGLGRFLVGRFVERRLLG